MEQGVERGTGAVLYDNLYEFSVVAQEGNLSSAAERLGISRPSLGRHMDMLEARLGVRLLVRGPSGVQLTEDGRYALTCAADVAAVGEAVRSRCASLERDLFERNLVMGGLTDSSVPLEALSRGCGSINGGLFSLSCSALPAQPVDEALSLLAAGKLDIVVAYAGEAHDHAGDRFAVLPLCSLSVCVSLGSGTAYANESRVGFEELRHLRFSCFPERNGSDDGVWREFARQCRRAGFSPVLDGTFPGRTAADAGFSNAAVVCASDSARADVLRSWGLRLAVVEGVELEVCAIVKADDIVGAELVRDAARSFAMGLSDRGAPIESIYSSFPTGDTLVGELSREERERLLSKVLDEPAVLHDLVLPDGTVVDKSYVALRNRLNRIADGISGQPVPTSYEAIMSLWTPQEARCMLEMPMFGLFTSYDYAVSSGRDGQAASALLEDLASRGLLYRVRRSGTTYYSLLTWAYGIWEFQLNHFDEDFLNKGIYGSEPGKGSQYPITHVCPISPGVVEGGSIAPYRDWEAYTRRQSTFCVSRCQCRVAKQVLEHSEGAGADHPGEVCFTFGEMAEYYIENGLGRRVSLEECLEAAHEAIEVHDLVPQLYYDRNPEVMCFCRPDFCLVLSAVKATGGLAMSMSRVSMYRVRYDAGACLSCGACVDRCPMCALSIDPAGAVVLSQTCVGCGQCVPVCPVGARVLEEKGDHDPTDLPADMIDGYRWRSEDRMARGAISDFTATRLGL